MHEAQKKSAKIALSVAAVLWCLMLLGLWATAAAWTLFVLVACLEDIRLTIARNNRG